MKKMLKTLCPGFLASAVMLGAMTFGAGTASAEDQQKPVNIIAITHIVAADPFGAVLKNGFEDAAEAMNVNIRYQSPDQYDTAQMQRMIEQAVAARPDGIALTIPDASAFARPIKQAINSGIPVIAINSGEEAAHELGALAYIGQSEYRSGKLAGERMKEAGIKRPVCLNFAPGQSQLDDRCRGFNDGFGDNSVQLSTTQDPTEITNAVFAYLNSHPDTDGIMSLGTLSTDPLLNMLKEQNALDQIKLATFDLSASTLTAVKEGDILFAIDQQQYLQGYLPVVTLALYKRYGLLPTTDIQTGPNFITQQNAEQVIELTRKGYR
ncbi:sugar ABC transporter substrate-binding protein [Salinicola sp. CPA57]|uniref:sugar ABC transporter substrate-binding protein n=1 Tax=Salinicola sp. CPA57 TaxID=1949080 RepID=UPI000DA1F7EA|nr:sugar ABC transporter substrate-binding protein [Salinicola sp. CPA57]